MLQGLRYCPLQKFIAVYCACVFFKQPLKLKSRLSKNIFVSFGFIYSICFYIVLFVQYRAEFNFICDWNRHRFKLCIQSTGLYCNGTYPRNNRGNGFSWVYFRRILRIWGKICGDYFGYDFCDVTYKFDGGYIFVPLRNNFRLFIS